MKTVFKTVLLAIAIYTNTQSFGLFTSQALTPAELKKSFNAKLEILPPHNQKAKDAIIKRMQDSLATFKGAVNQSSEILINFTKNKTTCPEESLAYYISQHGWTAYTQSEIQDTIIYLSALYITLNVPARDLSA